MAITNKENTEKELAQIHVAPKWKEYFHSKWALPFIVVTIFITILSLRLLSDPDLGFHLKAGKWIVENGSFPSKDTFTYTVNNNDYTDLHWLFQISVFLPYSIISYKGLSIVVCLLSLWLLFLLLKRQRMLNIPLGVTSVLLFAAYLIIEPRIVLRPEMFTYIFITFMLLLLDGYYYFGKKQLFFLPIIMLLWCNMHALFILGFVLIGAYFISIYLRDKKADRYFLLWMIVSVAVCFINPYFYKGFTFPLELFSRFDSNNIYNQHIKEFISFFNLDHFTAKDIIFIIYFVITILLVLFTLMKRKWHEFILIAVFLYLALISIRNIPLFTIIALPISAKAIKDVIEYFRNKKVFKSASWIEKSVYYLLIIVPVLLMFRLFTNAYYIGESSFSKTGIGINDYQHPTAASEFLVQHKLDGRIINSIGFGGWLEWSIPQPVFIDGRLEVMKEDLYNEVVKSWSGGLKDLIAKYQPKLIVYSYLKYYPWTKQLAAMPDWRLIYVDGNTAIFASTDYAKNIPSFDISSLTKTYNLIQYNNEQEKIEVLSGITPNRFTTWMEGFYKPEDFQAKSLLNLATFCLQMKEYVTAESLFLEILKRTEGRDYLVYYALAEIYVATAQNDKAEVCYHKILSFNPKDKTARHSLQNSNTNVADTSNVIHENKADDEAKILFNNGNLKYKNGDAEGAIKDYDKAIALKPDYYKAYNNRGIIKSSLLQQYNEAIPDFNKAIEIHPDYAEAYLGRGSSKYNIKDYTGACSDWHKAYELGNQQAKEQIDKLCK
jgi:tetratricopeptide (TPR) repeat protein